MDNEINETIKDSVERKISKAEIQNKDKKEFMNTQQISTASTLYNSNANSKNIFDSKYSVNSNSINQDKSDENQTQTSMSIVSSNNSFNPNSINSINNNIFPKNQIQNNLLMFNRQNIFNAFGDQNSTIYLQKQLRSISMKEIDYIIKELQGTFREIIKDKNGNYFCNDLFKECTQEQRIVILNELYQTLSEDCLNNYSCHPIQTLIERANNEMEYKLILYSFNDYNKLLFASLDPNGAYTIQKIIERIPDRYRAEFNFIFSSFIGFTSRKKYGIITVKKFISETKSDSVTEQIMKFIEENFLNLAVDQYANYLIQFLLEKWNNTPEGNEIKKLIKYNFDKLSQKKYSSFICECYIKVISTEEKRELINSLNVDKIRESNNHHSMKILKLLGINNNNSNNNSYNDQKNNSNNNPNFNFQLPMSLNNNKINNPGFFMNNNNYPNFNIPNNMCSRFDFPNTNYSNNNSGINNYNPNNINIPFNNMNNNPNGLYINPFTGNK